MTSRSIKNCWCGGKMTLGWGHPPHVYCEQCHYNFILRTYGFDIVEIWNSRPEGQLEVVVCAAVKTTCGQVIRCHRHHDGIRSIIERGLLPDNESGQGFITSRGRFVDRIEAKELQDAAGIPSASSGGYRGNRLYSEDLY